MPKSIHSDHAPAAIGPYSQAAVVGDFVFCSGQLGLDPLTGAMVPGGVEAETKKALANLEKVLEAAESGKTLVAKTTLFLTNMEDFEAVNKIYADFFGDHKPARSTVAVAALPKGALVEIECIARIA